MIFFLVFDPGEGRWKEEGGGGGTALYKLQSTYTVGICSTKGYGFGL